MGRVLTSKFSLLTQRHNHLVNVGRVASAHPLNDNCVALASIQVTMHQAALRRLPVLGRQKGNLVHNAIDHHRPVPLTAVAIGMPQSQRRPRRLLTFNARQLDATPVLHLPANPAAIPPLHPEHETVVASLLSVASSPSYWPSVGPTPHVRDATSGTHRARFVSQMPVSSSSATSRGSHTYVLRIKFDGCHRSPMYIAELSPQDRMKLVCEW